MAKAAELSGSLLGVRKGEAPAPAPPETVVPAAPASPKRARPATKVAAAKPVRPVYKGLPPMPDLEPVPVEEQRVAITARVRLATKERLRRAVFVTRSDFQDLVDEAISAYLETLGL